MIMIIKNIGLAIIFVLLFTILFITVTISVYTISSILGGLLNEEDKK